MLHNFRIFLLLSFLSQQSFSQNNKTEPNNNTHSLSIGAAIVTTQSIYTGGENETRLFPAFNYKFKQFYIQGSVMGLHVFNDNKFEFDLGLGADITNNIDRQNSDQLVDMPNLSMPFNAFLSAKYKSSIGHFKIAYEEEINNKHNGNKIVYSYTAAFHAGKWLFIPQLKASQYDAKAMNYFYGVTQDFSLANRPLYTLDKEFVYQIGTSIIYPFNKKTTLITRVNLDIFGNEIKNSPIVEDDKSVSLVVALTYKFF